MNVRQSKPQDSTGYGVDAVEQFKVGYLATLGALGLAMAMIHWMESIGLISQHRGSVALSACVCITMGFQAFMVFGPAARVARRRMRQVVEHSARTTAQAEAKARFLANMSHEIRTPMTAIVGYADLMLDPQQEMSDRLDGLQAIRRNAEHLLGLINDILDHSRIEAGQLNIERIECSPTDIVRDAIAMMNVRAMTKGLTLDVEYALPLPRIVHTDPARLRQILINLIGNALKFTEKGGVHLRVSLEQSAVPRLRFEVSDTGVGMSAQQIAGLFKPYAQADRTITRKYGGTGLGLTISKSLADALGGSIGVTSTLGTGSKFFVTIATGPISDAMMVRDLTEIEAVRSGVSSGGRGASPQLIARVLLAEDGPDNQRLITLHLRRAGATVDLAEDGERAVTMALAARDTDHAYDLVLMDMQMPRLNGYEATAKLRQNSFSTPIVALTANAMAGDREKCLAAGCDAYLTKPIDRAALIRTCTRWVGKHAVTNAV